MRTTLIYDLPTRLFHWLFGGFFLTSFIIAKTVDDESAIFMYHMLSGLMLGTLVLWRVAWGVIGSKHARFENFSLNPMDLKDYMFGIISGSSRRWAGHNPASSWAALAMLALAAGLAFTGYLMTSGYKESVEDIHEFMANTFIVVVVLHVAGVVIHTLRHKDVIGLSMVDGKKDCSDTSQSIPSSHPIAGLLLLALMVSAGIYLFKHFDSQQGQVQLFGQTLQLGENESGGASESDDD